VFSSHLAFSKSTLHPVVRTLADVFSPLQNNATLTTIFANYLFVDVSLSTIGRLATLILFPTLRAELCSATSIHALLQSQNGSDNLVLADNGLIAQDMVGQCRQVVVVLQALLGLLAVGLTFVQVMLAIRVNRYGQELRRLETMVDVKKLVGLTPSFVKMEEKKKYVVLE